MNMGDNIVLTYTVLCSFFIMFAHMLRMYFVMQFLCMLHICMYKKQCVDLCVCVCDCLLVLRMLCI